MGTRKQSILWLFAALFALSSFNVSAQCDRQRDSLVLVDLYRTNPGLQPNVNWVTNGLPIDSWTGIVTNAEGCVTRIDLFLSKLRFLPNSIGTLSELQYLIVNFNDLKNIPASIGDLENLEILEVSFNELTRLPESIQQLNKLRGLGISGNNFDPVPSWIGNMSNIQNLGLSDSRLLSVPPWIRNMESLNLLNLAYNNIEELPAWIGEMNNLGVLDFHSNRISSLPEELANMPFLFFMAFGYNQIPEIPEWVQGVPRLTGLDFSGNGLKEIPAWIGNLTNLEELYLSDNHIRTLPGSMANLTKLNRLRVDGNELVEIPEWIGNFTEMSQLWMFGNHLEELPFSLSDLTRLSWFAIDDNNLSFSDVEQVASSLSGTARFDYAPQKAFYVDTLLYFAVGSEGRISLGIDGNIPDNEYRWTKDKLGFTPHMINDINSNELIIPEIKLEDVGNYMASVTNPRFPELTLESFPIGIRVCDRRNDSLELVRLYTMTNGPGWDRRVGWLSTAPIDQWYGVTTDDMGCVNKIDLQGNGLTGTLPGLDLNTLDTLIVGGNELAGDIPNDLFTPYIKYADFSDNSFSGPFPMVVTQWMELTNLDVSDNFLRQGIPPEMGDLCELEQLEMDGNGFEGQIPTELTQLFNLKKGQVSFANNSINNMEQEWIYFCPFGVEIMANNPGGFERFVTICGDTCTGMEFSDLEDHPWFVEAIKMLNCTGEGCYNKRVSSDAGFVEVRGVTVAYTRTRCYTDENEYNEAINFYDCGGYLLDTYICNSEDFCPGIAVLSPEEFEALEFDSRWSCLCNGVQCIPNDTVAIDAGEVDTLLASEFLVPSDNCSPGLYGLSSLNNELPGSPPFVTEDNIGFSYTLINENLISGAQCTTTIEVVRGITGRDEYAPGKNHDPFVIDCHPNPVVDFLRCPEVDMATVEEYKVFNIQGMEMPKYAENYKDKLQLNVQQYPSGMYILVVWKSDQQYINRFTVFR